MTDSTGGLVGPVARRIRRISGPDEFARVSRRTASPAPDASDAPSRDSAFGYRPALDGIRAVAILAVIAYHFGYRWAPGGFLGVDAFFVLSGYLITSLLLAEQARTGRIALLQFWLRRARRLLPALFVMLIAVAVWIGLNGAPFEMSMRREDLFWTLFYGANWHLVLSGQDYFAAFSSASPLLHTWSLAIEEQFYILWPLIVGAALWIGRKRPVVLGAVCVIGIAVSVAAMAILFDPLNPSLAYYSTETRMHQLLVGALLAVLMTRRELVARFRPAARIVGALAAVGLFGSFAIVHDQDTAYYYGLSIVLATTAAALVWAVEVDPRQPVAWLLSLRPVAWVGKISYGLYLWHWPVILAITTVPAPLSSLPGTSTGLNLTRLAVTFGIEIASFYLLEQPIRRCRMPVLGRSARRFVVATGVAILVVSGVTITTTAADPELTTVSNLGCPTYTVCLRHMGRPGSPVVALIGDSIAKSLDPAFLAMATEHGWTYVLQANSGCRVSHVHTVPSPANEAVLPDCYANTPGLQRELLSKWRPNLGVMADFMETVAIQDEAGRNVVAGTDEFVALEEQALGDVARTVTASGSKMALLKLPPRLGTNCAKSSNFSAPDCTFKVGPTSGPKTPDALYERLAKKLPGVSALSIMSAVCPNNVCSPMVGGVILRSDGLHYTPKGAMALVPTLERQILALVPL